MNNSQLIPFSQQTTSSTTIPVSTKTVSKIDPVITPSLYPNQNVPFFTPDPSNLPLQKSISTSSQPQHLPIQSQQQQQQMIPVQSQQSQQSQQYQQYQQSQQQPYPSQQTASLQSSQQSQQMIPIYSQQPQQPQQQTTSSQSSPQQSTNTNINTNIHVNIPQNSWVKNTMDRLHALFYSNETNIVIKQTETMYMNHLSNNIRSSVSSVDVSNHLMSCSLWGLSQVHGCEDSEARRQFTLFMNYIQSAENALQKSIQIHQKSQKNPFSPVPPSQRVASLPVTVQQTTNI